MLAQLYYAQNKASPSISEAGEKRYSSGNMEGNEGAQNSSSFFVTSSELFNHIKGVRGENVGHSSGSIGQSDVKDRYLSESSVPRSTIGGSVSHVADMQLTKVKKFSLSEAERRCAEIDTALLETLGESKHNVSSHLTGDFFAERRKEFFQTVFNTGKTLLLPPLLNEQNAIESLNYEYCPFEKNYYFALEKLKLLKG